MQLKPYCQMDAAVKPQHVGGSGGMCLMVTSHLNKNYNWYNIIFNIIRPEHPRRHVNRKAEFKKTLLKRGATVGANATIVCGNIIGEYAMIGAGTVITKDVKPFALMVGVPAKQIGWVDLFGERLEFNVNNQAFDEAGNQYILVNNEVVLK